MFYMFPWQRARRDFSAPTVHHRARATPQTPRHAASQTVPARAIPAGRARRARPTWMNAWTRPSARQTLSAPTRRARSSVSATRDTWPPQMARAKVRMDCFYALFKPSFPGVHLYKSELPDNLNIVYWILNDHITAQQFQKINFL